MSRNMKMNGERRLRVEDISFESEAFNIYYPFYTSESDMSSGECSDSDYSDENSSLNKSLSGYGSSSYISSEEPVREPDHISYSTAVVAMPQS